MGFYAGSDAPVRSAHRSDCFWATGVTSERAKRGGPGKRHSRPFELTSLVSRLELSPGIMLLSGVSEREYLPSLYKFIATVNKLA